MIEADELKKLLSYCPNTGILTWKFRDNGYPQWNARYSGKPALTAINDNGYMVGKVFSRMQRAHRVAWAVYYGNWPTGIIDHINGNKTDNRIANMRSVTNQENQRNCKLSCANTSGHTGVFLVKRTGKWEAAIRVGKLIRIGQFSDKAEAVAVRKTANEKYGFSSNHGKKAKPFTATRG